MSEADPTHDVVIVGGGHAGLCVVSALNRHGVRPLVVDAADRLGDTWRERYDGLVLNTTRKVSAIPDTVLPTSVGRWPTRDEWADHVESAAAQLDLEHRPVRVDRVVRAADGSWLVDTGGEAAADGLTARAVVVATGRNRVPVVPEWPGLGDTSIEVLHSADFRRADPFVGRRILVVGTGNSGTEIAHLLAEAGVDVSLSMRTRPVCARRELFGSDLSRFAAIGRRLPPWLVDASGRAMQPLLFGAMRRYGLGPPQRRLSRVDQASGATLDSGVVADVKSGRVRLLAAVEALDGDEVVLADGMRVTVDVVVAATGYRPALEGLMPSGTLDGRGWPHIGVAPFEQAPGLFTAGLNPATLTAFHPDFIREADHISQAIVSGLAR